jgi:hypothetical protein
MDIQRFRAARDRGVAWLLRQLNPDGSIGLADRGTFYYRAPWAFALAGETAAGLRLLDWIRRHRFTPDGAFVSGDDQSDSVDSWYPYPLSSLIVGAHLLRQFDMSERGVQHLLTRQDPTTGGFYSRRDDSSDAAFQELAVACGAMLPLVITGQLDAAERVGDFLVRLWELQPEPADRLYCIYTREARLLTRFPEAIRKAAVNEAHDGQQYHYNGGFAAASLAYLYLACPKPIYLETARRYMAFSMNSTPRQFEVQQVCKSGWGAALLYSITREPVYRDWAIKLGDWFIGNQFPDGYWVQTRTLEDPPKPTTTILITAEFVMHLDSIYSALACSEETAPS